MLAANAFESAAAAFRGDVERLGNDVATTALSLVNAVQLSKTNAPTLASVANQWNKVDSVLVADFNQTWQAYVHLELAVLGDYQPALLALLRVTDPLVNELDPQPAAAFPSVSPTVLPNPPDGGAGTTARSHGNSSGAGLSPPTVVIPHAPSSSSRKVPTTIVPDISPPPQEYVYFSSSSYTVNENAGSVTLQVDLFTASSVSVSVALATSNGTATSGIDYNSVNTNVVFQPGTTSQTVTVVILDDGTRDDSAGSESFSAQLSNPTNARLGNGPSSATVNIQEGNGIGSGPVANNDSYTLMHDTTYSVDSANGVLANDNDPNNLPLSAVLVSGPSDGALTLNSNGSFLYTPKAHWIGTDSFQYYATDGRQNSNTATVTLNVQDTGTITAQPDSYSTPHDQVLSVAANTGVLANDTDSDGDPITANLASWPSHGTLQLNPDGSFTYTPSSGYSGNDSFQYTASDGVQSSAPITVSISVTNTLPTAANHAYGVPENTNANVTAANGLLQGTSDSDGDYLALSSWTQPSDGALQVNPDGSFTYTPNTSYVGSDSFQYTISDGTSTATATVTFNIHAADTAPVANPDSFSVERNNAFSADAGGGLLANDTDSDGDPLTALLVSGPTNGTLTLNSDGSFTYAPNTNFTGTDTFTYKAGDGVLTSQPATVTLMVSGSAPIASDQTFTVEGNTALNAPAGALLLEAYNPDNMALTAQDVSQPSNGTVAVNSNGSFIYTPNSGFTGSDTFTYDLTDGSLVSSPATITIIVNASDTAPTVSTLNYTVDENNSLNIDSTSGLLSGASDSDGDRLLATLVSGPNDGTLTLHLDGSFTYTPNAGYSGADSFQYKIFDGTGYSNAATVALTVTSNVPTANNDTYGAHSNTTLNVSALIGVLANDSDQDGLSLSATLVSSTSHGTLTLNSDGSFSYVPNAGFTGTDSFTYQASNGVANSNVATVTLSVSAPNSPPIANNDTYSTPHNTPLSIVALGVLTNDTDPDNDPLSANLISSPSHGSLTFNSDGSFTYTPSTNFIGTDFFTYQANDGLLNSNTATVTISITDNPPSAGDDSYAIAHGQALTVSTSSGVLAKDSDPDGDPLTAQLVSGPNNGTLQFHGEGSFTYTPDSNFAGVDSFTYEANDGMMISSPATVFLHVTDAAPLAVNDYSTVYSGGLLLDQSGVLYNAYDPDGDPMTARLVAGPTHGTLELSPGGQFNYQSDAGYVGNDSFTYQATDGLLTSNIATETITAVPYSTAPLANSDEFATGLNQPLTMGAPGVLWNDGTSDHGTLTAKLDTEPSHGTLTLNSDGSFTYTPNTGFFGDDSFTYYACEGSTTSANPATVTIHVSNVTLAMPNGPWVPINANDDNGSAITNMIPAIRDYNYLRQLPANDPQLQPLNITIKNPNPLGFVKLQIQSAAGTTGQIRLWSDQKKTKQIMPGVYPVMGPNALPATIYVEGINPTSRTIANNSIQQPVPDNTITATYFVINPAMPGGGAGAIPVGSTQVSVGVTPVTQFFTINNVPVPPNPPVNPKTAGVVNFGNRLPGLPGSSPANDIRFGYQSYGVNPSAPNPLAPVLGQSAATFNAQVFNANVPGALHFVQNETITNGALWLWKNAWTFAAGGPAPQNWFWRMGRQEVPTRNNPRLDMAAQQNPPPPYYQSLGIPILGNNLQIMSGDNPSADDVMLVRRLGLGGGAQNFTVTDVAWTFKFSLYLVWSMPAGGGLPGDVIYTLAARPWAVSFIATTSRANDWANIILPGFSGIFTPGDFTITNRDPLALTGPTANQVATIK